MNGAAQRTRLRHLHHWSPRRFPGKLDFGKPDVEIQYTLAWVPRFTILRCGPQGQTWNVTKYVLHVHVSMSFRQTGFRGDMTLRPLRTPYCRGNEQESRTLINNPFNVGYPHLPPPSFACTSGLYTIVLPSTNWKFSSPTPTMLSLRLLGTAFVTWTLVLASDHVQDSLRPDSIGWSSNNASMPLSTQQLLPRELPKGECNEDTPCAIEACCNGHYVRERRYLDWDETCTDLGFTPQVWLWRRVLRKGCVCLAV